jgi:CRISPR-associated protein Cmr4
MFFYAITPVRMGAGTALGLIDNPIQREVHTNHPVLAGSGLKGAMRHRAERSWGDESKDTVFGIFGPDSKEASDFAGAVSITDGVLVAFPVRCLKQGWIYATSASALARAARLLEVGDSGTSPWEAIPQDGDKALAASTEPAVEGRLILEAFEFPVEKHEAVEKAAAWLAANALPGGDGHEFFCEKLKRQLVVLPEYAFGHFVERATVVEPHVRIDDTTGTADGGGLFYTENLPPESLMLALLMASDVRSGRANGIKTATDVVKAVIDGVNGAGGLDKQLLQIGGDATTGRGQVLVRFVGV